MSEITSIETMHRGTHPGCSWKGPARDNIQDAQADATQHRTGFATHRAETEGEN